MTNVRWGFIGAGAIAQSALTGAVHQAKNADLYAVASRDRARSASIGAECIYDSYEELLQDPLIDAVYISLANHQHLEWVIRSLEAGKHVLCEKPLGLNPDEVERMMSRAREKQRLLVEAVWTRWHPRFQRLIAATGSGEVGTLETITSAFTFEGNIEGNYRANPQMGGGALLDVGVYEIHSWVALVGRSQEFTVVGIERVVGDTGIDLTTGIHGQFSQGCSVQSLSSFVQPELQKLEISGSHGLASMQGNEAFTSWKSECSLVIMERNEEFAAVDAYQLMVEQVSAAIRNEPAWIVPIEDSLRVAQLIDQISRS